MKEQTIANLDAVMREAEGMLETIANVRGERHASLVKALVMGTKASELASILATHSMLDADVLDGISSALSSCLRGVVVNLMVAGQIDDCTDAVEDAKRVDQSVSALSAKAYMAGEFGGRFGD